MKGKPDTYVQLFLQPGKHMEIKTKVVRNNPNPLFEETFNFKVRDESFKNFQKQMIILHIIHNDTFSKKDEIKIPLNTIGINQKVSFVREINPVSTPAKPSSGATPDDGLFSKGELICQRPRTKLDHLRGYYKCSWRNRCNPRKTQKNEGQTSLMRGKS